MAVPFASSNAFMLRLPCSLVIWASLGAAALCADWPHLRGPACTGESAETGLKVRFAEGQPPRLWSFRLGQGHSGIVVANRRLYTQYQTIGGQYLLCLDAATGEKHWEVRVDRPWQTRGAYPGPYATPTLAGGRVFYASPTGKVGCLEGEDGTPVWSVDVRDRFGGRGFDFGYAATPLVEEGCVILPVGGPDASLVALDAHTGETRWTAGGDPASYCPALPFTFQGRRCVLGYLQNALLFVETASGKVLFRQRLSSGYDEHSAWPLYREPQLLLSAPFRAGATCSELRDGPGGTISLQTRWTSRELSNDVASSVLHGEEVFGFDLKQPQSSAHRASRGAFRCLDWATGRVHWSTEEVGHAGLIAADGKLFLLNDSGTLIIALADPTAYVELARFDLFPDEICWTPPALSRRYLYVRSPSQLICLDLGAVSGDATAPRSLGNSALATWWPKGAWLVSTERDFPNDAPSTEESGVWFVAGLSMLLLAALASRRPTLTLTVAGGLAFLGPNGLSLLAGRLLFTWPLALAASLQLAVNAAYQASRPKAAAQSRWTARIAVAVLVGVCLGYYVLCKTAGMPVAWGFLCALPAAFPFAVLSARAESRGRPWIAVLWCSAAYTALFWTGVAYLDWKATEGLVSGP